MVTFDEDVLCGTCRTDGINRSLVEGNNKVLVHGIVLIVGVKDDLAVILEQSSELGPEGAESSRVSNNGVVVATIVVWVQDSICASRSDGIDGSCQVGSVGSVEGAGESVLGKTFHLEGNSEGVVSLRDESGDCSWIWEGKVLAPCAWKTLLAELSSGFVDTEP